MAYPPKQKILDETLMVVHQTVSDTQPPPPHVIEEPPANTNASLISSINLTCTAEVSSAPSYQWLKDGVPIAGEMKAFLYIVEVTTHVWRSMEEEETSLNQQDSEYQVYKFIITHLDIHSM